MPQDKNPKQLMVILEDQDISKENAAELIAAFGAPFIEAGEILSTYQEIKVTDESQVELMAEAKDKRLSLKKIRTSVETRRKELKEASLKTGRGIDSVAKYVKETIEPAEKYLELQEKFVEIALKEKAASLKSERTEKLMQYADDISVYNLDSMEEATFSVLLADLKKRHDDKVAAEKAEADRIEKERIEELERQKARDAENARLKLEAEERQKLEDRKIARINQITQIGLSWDASADAYVLGDLNIKRELILDGTDEEFNKHFSAVKTVIDKLVADQKKAEADAQKVRDEQLRKERDAAEAERKRREQLEEQERNRKAAEAKAQADEEEAERKALLAPDKEKLLAFASQLAKMRTEQLPAVKLASAQKTINHIESSLTTLIEQIRDQANNL